METTTFDISGSGNAIAALLPLILDRSSATTFSRQVFIAVRELILSGRLPGGARLPSTRRLAIDLDVSRTVTLTAYDQLAAEGYLDARRGSGQYVREFNRLQGAASSDSDAGPPPNLSALSTRGKLFDPSMPPWDLFPIRTWAGSIARGWRREGAVAIDFEHWAGLPSLRSAVATHLRAMQGLDCSADQIVITGGNTDALQLIVGALGMQGAEAWVEDPGHVGARCTLANLGLQTRAIPVDGEGLQVAAGQQIAPNARLVLLTPSRQFPLGMPLSLSRRLALIDWAQTSKAVIVEDDYDSELRFSGRPMASLLGLGSENSVLAIGSFSKLTFAGLRLGYVVGSKQLIAGLVSERERQGVPVAASAQPALASFIANGDFAKHLRMLRRTIAHRRLALIDAINTHLADRVTILPQEVGMHLTVMLRNCSQVPMTDTWIAERAVAKGLNISPLSAHSIDTICRQGFLLGYAAWEGRALARGIEALAALMPSASSSFELDKAARSPTERRRAI